MINIHSIMFEEGLRLPAASSVKRIRVDTPIPIALHITSEPVPLFLQRFGTWPSSGNSNEYRGSHTRAVYTQSVAPKKMRIMSPSVQKGGGQREKRRN